ncbi:MAG: hypothetical protein ACHQ7M_20970 [Chloroflexota bacterium]
MDDIAIEAVTVKLTMDCLRRLQREAAGKDCKVSEQDLPFRRKQAIAPGDRRPQ